MLTDINQIAIEYGKAYKDKSRIYFIEKYLSTFNASKGKKTPFKLFPRQKVFLKTLANERNVVAIKPRQCGITTLTSAWVTGQCVFAPKDAPETVLCVGNKLDLANQLITKIREFLTQVPRWYWGDDYYSPDPRSDKNNKSIFTKDSKSELQLFNGCHIIARSSGENSARGISAVSTLILDEAGFIENGQSVYATCAATMASNPNSKTVMVSTPNGHDELYYVTYKQALAHENNFTAVQFRWYQDPRYNKFLKWHRKSKKTGQTEWYEEPLLNAGGDVEYNEQHWENMIHQGWTPTSNWYEDMKKQFNNDPIKIAQELDVSFQGSANNVVAPEFIDKQSDLNVREPLADFKDPMNEDTWFWKKPIDGHRYICACLPTGEQILTQRGLINVENILENDKLITKEGNFTQIKHRKYRDVVNEKMISIKVYGLFDSFNMTWNHPVWSSITNISKRKYNQKKYLGTFWEHNFQFNNADSLNNKSWIEIPNIYHNHTLKNEEILKYWEKYNHYSGNSNIDCPLLSEDFWWYCGMWVAEGFIYKLTNGTKRIVTVHNINEKEYYTKIMEIVKKFFKRKANITIRESQHTARIYFGSIVISEFLENTFGKYARFKHIAEWVKFLPPNLKIQFIKGYLEGDGSEWHGYLSAESASKQLINDIQDILFSLGLSSSVTEHRRQFYEKEICGKKTKSNKAYSLKLSLSSSNKFKIMISKNDIDPCKYSVKKFMYFSDDKTKIYIKIKNISEYQYTGKVYNFETVSSSHSYCFRGCATHNCDPSIGTSADRTAIEIIDMDGRDENGQPILEQVAEYLGRKLGDDIGGMVYQYANLYNQAYVVVDATGGIGNSLILTLLNLGYKNFYYEDQNQKNYTIQNKIDKPLPYINKLPGFHFQGNRYPVLTGFAGMVRSNEFKIRSTRVINELETWIFDANGRMDHQSGAHDDSICALAMGLFVMKYTYNKLIESKHKDEAILNAYMSAGSYSQHHPTNYSDKPITPKNGLPFYSEHTIKRTNQNFTDKYGNNCLWLFAGYY